MQLIQFTMANNRMKLCSAWAFAGLIALASKVRLTSLANKIEISTSPHYALHIGGYAFLAALMMFAAQSRRQQILFLLSMILLAFGGEYYQYSYDGRPYEYFDVLADVIGMLLGVIPVLIAVTGVTLHNVASIKIAHVCRNKVPSD